MKNKNKNKKSKSLNNKLFDFLELVRSINLANKLTILRILLTPFFILSLSMFMVKGWLIVALAIFIVAAVTDYLDGHIARTRLMSTPLGQFLDPIADKILVTSALVIMTHSRWIWGWTVAVIVIRDLIVSGIRLVAIESDSKVVIPARSSGKIKTAVTMFSIGILIFLWTLASFGIITYEAPLSQVTEHTVVMHGTYVTVSGDAHINAPALLLRPIGNSFMVICTALTVYSGIEYVWDSRKILKKAFSEKKK